MQHTQTKIITPPEISDVIGPLITLILPRTSRRQWQNEAIQTIREQDQNIAIATARLPFPTTELYPSQDHHQTWKQHYLELASKNGSPLFWLAREGLYHTHENYAANTKMLLQEWFQRHRIHGDMFSLGIEPGFIEGEAIRYRFSTHCPSIPLADNMHDTCKNALHITYDRLREE